MDLDLRVLRYFVAVAEAGTYTAAAADLRIAAPSLSQQIRKLERDLDLRLFDRDHRGARLTPAGREVLDHTRRMLAEQEQLFGIARRRRRAHHHTLRIGILAGMAGPHTRTLLDQVRDTASADARVELTQIAWPDQVSAVVDGHVDAMIARPPLPTAPVRRIRLLTEPRVLVMAADHPLASHSALRLADLDGVVQVNTDGVDETWRSFWTCDPRPDGTHPHYGPVVHSVEEMLEVCAATTAVGITAASLADLYPRPDLAYRTITDVAPSTVELLVKNAPLTPLTHALVTAADRWSARTTGHDHATAPVTSRAPGTNAETGPTLS